MRKKLFYILILSLLAINCQADAPRMELDIIWSKSISQEIADLVIADVNWDGKDEIIVGYKNNSVVTYDRFGNPINEFYLGNQSTIGSIYAMHLADVDEDGREEIIFGLGGAKEIRTYDLHEFEVDEKGMSIKSKDEVLYQVTRYHGAVYVTELDGKLVWRRLMQDSVKSVAYHQSEFEGGYVIAGVGDQIIYIMNERSGERMSGEVCTYNIVTDEISGWATKASCENPNNCCPDSQVCGDCTAYWDDDIINEVLCDKCLENKPPNLCKDECQTTDVCIRSYELRECRKDATGDIIGWQLVTYKQMNGTIHFLDKNGIEKYKYGIFLKDEQSGKIITEIPITTRIIVGKDPVSKEARFRPVDNTITSLISKDIDGDGREDIIVGSNNGEFYTLNVSNLSTIRIAWKNSMDSEVKKVNAGNIDEESHLEIVAGDNFGSIVVCDSSGEVKFRQRVDDSITDIYIADVEGDGVSDLVVTSRDRKIYVIDGTGNIIWSYNFRAPVYGVAVADIDKNEMQDFIVYSTKNITRLQTNEFYIKKFRADRLYERAYDAFSQNDNIRASIYVDTAYDLYTEINDKDSLPKCRLLRARIDESAKVEQVREAENYFNMALSYYSINDLDSALSNLEKSKMVFEKIEHAEGIRKCDELLQDIKDDSIAQRRIFADGLYIKAVTLSNFGNFTGALQLIDEAKTIYNEIEHYNETKRCDDFIVGIGDKHLRLAQSALATKTFERALSYVSIAAEIYSEIGRQDKIVEAMDLEAKIIEERDKPPENIVLDGEYTVYVIGTVILMIVIVVFMLSSRNKKPKKITMKSDEDLKRIIEKEDELGILEEEL